MCALGFRHNRYKNKQQSWFFKIYLSVYWFVHISYQFIFITTFLSLSAFPLNPGLLFELKGVDFLFLCIQTRFLTLKPIKLGAGGIKVIMTKRFDLFFFLTSSGQETILRKGRSFGAITFGGKGWGMQINPNRKAWRSLMQHGVRRVCFAAGRTDALQKIMSVVRRGTFLWIYIYEQRDDSRHQPGSSKLGGKLWKTIYQK